MTIVLAFVGGAALWSLLEYALHRWNGHEMKGRTFFSREHLTHHTRRGYFTPAATKAKFAAPVLAGVGGLAAWVAGPAGAAFAGGFALAYLGYEVLHYRLHVAPPRGPYGRWARRHHFAHHFTCPRHNHGVTSPVWDWVFGTYQRPAVVRVPERLAMTWLVDPATGEARARYAGDYAVTRRKGRATAETTDMDAAYEGVAPT